MSLPSIVSQSDRDTILKSKDPSKRYIVLYNSTSQDLYPVILASDFASPANLITDKSDSFPSGFLLKSGTYKLLTTPRYVNSARITARTGCTMVPGRYPFAKSESSLKCTTADCPHDASTYPTSDNGVRCGSKSGTPPATLAEFTFDQLDQDYFDVSQADGFNINAAMYPVVNGSGPYCNKSACLSTLTRDECPAELRVYDNSNKYVACQTICAAMTSARDGLGKLPDGSWSNSLGPLSVNEPDGYKKLIDMSKVTYMWDPDATTPTVKPASGDSREFIKKGRWVPKACTVDGSTCVSTKTLVCCEGSCNDSSGQSSQQLGCSPYVTTYTDPSFAKHLCWSENWPGGTMYHDIFKKKCTQAYSWPFDDLTSTFQCKNDKTGPPVHYVVEFSDGKTEKYVTKPPSYKRWLLMILILLLIVIYTI